MLAGLRLSWMKDELSTAVLTLAPPSAATLVAVVWIWPGVVVAEA